MPKPTIRTSAAVLAATGLLTLAAWSGHSGRAAAAGVGPTTFRAAPAASDACGTIEQPCSIEGITVVGTAAEQL